MVYVRRMKHVIESAIRVVFQSVLRYLEIKIY